MTAQDPAPPSVDPDPASSAAAVRNAVADSLRFFTILPLPARWVGVGYNGVAAASPLAGVVVALVAGAALILSLAAGLPPLPAAVAAVIVSTVVSGALHLDGMADVADAMGGHTPERRLDIMRDSRLGAFGGAALMLALIARVALTAALVGRLGAIGATLALVAAAALSRPLAFLPTLLLDPARTDGLGSSARPAIRMVAIGCGLGCALAFICAGLAMGISSIALAGAAAAGVAALARRKFGGYTGDVCGAACEAGEIAALAGLLAAAA